MATNNNQLVTEITVIDNDSSFRFVYMYDNNGNKMLETKFYQNNDSWVRKSQKEWIFSNNKCLNQTERTWNNNKWSVNYTIDYNYDGELISSEIHNYYSNDIANLLKKIKYQYNSNLLRSKEEYIRQSDSWDLSVKTDFTYMPDNKTDSITITNFQSGNVESQQLSTFSYNLDGTLSSQLFQERNDSAWTNSLLINWFYKSGQITTQKNKKWIAENNNWENTQRIDYEYNNNVLASETYQHWKTMFWTNDIRYDYFYDNDNNETKKVMSEPIYNEWRNLISINYSDFMGKSANFIESKYEFWGGVTGDLITSYVPYLFNNELTIQKAKSIQINYLPVADSLTLSAEINDSQHYINVYPNPSSGIYYINTQKYNVKSWSVSGLNGQIFKKQLQSFQSGVIDICDLPKGIYLLRVNTVDGQLIQKLLKE